ncbi:MAG TPA: cytochrome c [Blastocatellia bacterium]|nr:cytochrome c [Blastocatellia bacterium]
MSISKNKPPFVSLARVAALALLLVCASACNQQMANEPKYIPLRASDSFADGKSARPLEDNTVPRGYLRAESDFYTGKTSAQPSSNGPAQAPSAPGSTPAGTTAAGKPSGPVDINYIPIPVTAELMERGRDRFNIFCTPCHGRLGDGQGMIVKRGFRQPPSYHIDRLRNAPLGHFFDVITNGFGAMPDYAQQIPPGDRWAIVAYIKALQLSQNATAADVPTSKRAQLENGGSQK